MKKCLYILVLHLAILSQPLLAQEAIQSDVPVKFDEFGQLPSERLYQHLDFALYLAKNLQQRGQFLIHTPKNYTFGFGYRMAARYKYYIEANLGLSTDKITFTQCDAEKDYRVEQYVIPQNVNNKTCVERVLPTDQTVLFDRIVEDDCSGGPSSAGCFYDGEIEVLLNILSTQLQKDLDSKAYLFIRPNRQMWDFENGISKALKLKEIIALTNKKLKKAKEFLTQDGIKPERIVTVKGNFHRKPYEFFIWKIWIVPKNGKIPLELKAKSKTKQLSKKANKK